MNRGSGAITSTLPLHALIEIKDSEGKDTILEVPDGKWAENADRGTGLGKDTKSVSLPANGETRTLDVVMRPHGMNDCHGWDHNGFAIAKPPIPPGVYQIRIELDASNLPEKRQFHFVLVNPRQVDEQANIDPDSLIELREMEGLDNASSAGWLKRRGRPADDAKNKSTRNAIAALNPLIDEGNRILDYCGRPAEQMRGADPMYFVNDCMPRINKFMNDAATTIREVAPEYIGKFVNIGNVTHDTDAKPAMIQQVERWLERLDQIQDGLRDRLP